MNELEQLNDARDAVAQVLEEMLEGTGVMHMCLLGIHEEAFDGGTHLAFVSDIDLDAIPTLLRELADQVEAKIAQAS